jgi:hypothetical protein
MFGLSGIRLWGALGVLLAALALIGTVARLDHLRASWKAKYEALAESAGALVAVIRIESGNRTLSLANAGEQVRLIASSRKAWQGTAELQSARIDDLANETARLKALSAELRARAEAAIAKRDSAIRRLSNAALDPGDRADCAQQLFDAEAALDDVYREGL